MCVNVWNQNRNVCIYLSIVGLITASAEQTTAASVLGSMTTIKARSKGHVLGFSFTRFKGLCVPQYVLEEWIWHWHCLAKKKAQFLWSTKWNHLKWCLPPHCHAVLFCFLFLLPLKATDVEVHQPYTGGGVGKVVLIKSRQCIDKAHFNQCGHKVYQLL